MVQVARIGGRGGGGEVIWAMPERKHFFLRMASLNVDGLQKSCFCLHANVQEWLLNPPAHLKHKVALAHLRLAISSPGSSLPFLLHNCLDWSTYVSV